MQPARRSRFARSDREKLRSREPCSSVDERSTRRVEPLVALARVFRHGARRAVAIASCMIMGIVARRLSLGILLIALTSAVLLLSETRPRGAQSQHVPRVAVLQQTSQPTLD